MCIKTLEETTIRDSREHSLADLDNYQSKVMMPPTVINFEMGLQLLLFKFARKALAFV